MAAPALDEQTLDRLLAGAIDPDDAPAGFQRVASLIVIATSGPTPEELRPPPGLADLARADPWPPRAEPDIGRRRTTFLSVAAGVLLAVTGTAAAANQLPDSVQQVVADVAEQLGLPFPDASPTPTEEPSRTLRDVGPNVPRPSEAPAGPASSALDQPPGPAAPATGGPGNAPPRPPTAPSPPPASHSDPTAPVAPTSLGAGHPAPARDPAEVPTPPSEGSPASTEDVPVASPSGPTPVAPLARVLRGPRAPAATGGHGSRR